MAAAGRVEENCRHCCHWRKARADFRGNIVEKPAECEELCTVFGCTCESGKLHTFHSEEICSEDEALRRILRPLSVLVLAVENLEICASEDLITINAGLPHRLLRH